MGELAAMVKAFGPIILGTVMVLLIWNRIVVPERTASATADERRTKALEGLVATVATLNQNVTQQNTALMRFVDKWITSENEDRAVVRAFVHSQTQALDAVVRTMHRTVELLEKGRAA